MTTPKLPPAAKHPPVPDEEEDLSIEYPDSDGEPMADNDWQWIAIADTAFTLRNRYAGCTDVYVASDMLMYYRMNDVTARVAPDVYVVFGANGTHRRYSWLTWREGKAPDFVLEVASPRTWRQDAGRKRNIYADMGVTEYWRFDPRGDFFVPELIGEELADGQYRPLPLHTDADGILRGHSGVLGLDICVRPGLELASTTRRPGNGSSRRRRATQRIVMRRRRGCLRRRPGGRRRRRSKRPRKKTGVCESRSACSKPASSRRRWSGAAPWWQRRDNGVSRRTM